MSKQDIKDSIRNIPDFPIKGIQFKDITTALKHPHLFHQITEELARHYSGKGITKVVAIESRGFIIGGALSYKLNAGFVPVRKPGKLPSATHKVIYDLEYGKDILEMHLDALVPEDVVLIHDDLLATGGTALATLNLVKMFNIKKAYLSFIIELDFLKGRNRLTPHEIFSLVHFDK
ncbi:MAG TPA: adenine phosphoribosyltransferase [Bacteroidales bacterium]|nr:adenine phosphoribosyltransferase [Bacteroidales bacterium]